MSTSRGDRRLHSFPTRRSSDLAGDLREQRSGRFAMGPHQLLLHVGVEPVQRAGVLALAVVSKRSLEFGEDFDGLGDRSEEHTSELQSHVNLVCRLLLEKKKPHT